MILDASRPHALDPGLAAERRLGLTVFVLATLPSLAAIWLVPWFVTQDGPAHVYNAHIILESLRPSSPFRDVYEVRWEPLPNWAGHLLTMALMEVLPARAADRAVISITLVGFAMAIAWLRWRVAGWRGMPLTAALSVLLALNMAWLFGFTSFLLGACLFALTLGLWWAGRERAGPLRAMGIAGLLVVGYFCHLVSLGLTAVGLVVLAATTPGPGRGRRWGLTLVSLAPLVGLAFLYRGIMKAGGPMSPEWGMLKDARSWLSWKAQLGWVDPLSLASKVILPFSDMRASWCGLLAPIVWFSLALLAFVAATVLGPSGREDPRRIAHDRRGWALLAALLLVGGVIGPDTIGPGHGNYLPQRVFLLGLVAAVPYLNLDARRGLVKLGGLALAFALLMQSAFVWGYALYSDRVAGAFMEAKPFVGRGQRVGTLLVDIGAGYRSNPLLHIDSMLGVGTGNLIWSNYETTHYYFPVQLRDATRTPPAAEFEAVAILAGPENRDERNERWRRLLEENHDQIDALVVWGSDPDLDALNARWFETRVQLNNVRVLRHIGLEPLAAKPAPP
ncbi:MAG TPA: hypothetical protein VGZ22_25815 [Isosphaeraceae bacterium]|nr:hypothetical protein [Isosphaeraceae bacterium]